MKRIAFVTVCVAAAAGFAFRSHPDEFKQYAGTAATAGQRAWDGVAANPVPVVLALGTFLLTVVYHKAKGKSLRESVEVAATRVTVVPVPVATGGVDAGENAVVRRAKARTTRTQLLADQIGLQNRLRQLPDAITRAEKDACYSEQVLTDAKRMVEDKQKAHDSALAKLEALRKECAEGEAELAELEVELKRLAEIV